MLVLPRRAALASALAFWSIALCEGCGSSSSPPASSSPESSDSEPRPNSVDDSGPRSPAIALPTPATRLAPGFEAASKSIDRSIPARSATRLGLAPLDKLWSAQNMTQAAVALETLGSEDPNFLPRSISSRSAPIFRKIIATDNLALFQVPNVSLNDRAADAFEYHEALARIFAVYHSAFRGAGRGDSELIELMGAQLRLAELVLDLNAQYVATLNPHDSRYGDRTEGAETVRIGAVTIIRGSLRTLSERDVYRSSERARLVTLLRETLPELLRRIDPQLREEILKLIDQLAADPALEELQPGLGGLRGEAHSRSR